MHYSHRLSSSSVAAEFVSRVANEQYSRSLLLSLFRPKPKSICDSPLIATTSRRISYRIVRATPRRSCSFVIEHAARSHEGRETSHTIDEPRPSHALDNWSWDTSHVDDMSSSSIAHSPPLKECPSSLVYPSHINSSGIQSPRRTELENTNSDRFPTHQMVSNTKEEFTPSSNTCTNILPLEWNHSYHFPSPDQICPYDQGQLVSPSIGTDLNVVVDALSGIKDTYCLSFQYYSS